KPAFAVDEMVTGPGQRVDHRQVRAAADRVHEHQHGVRRVVLGLEQIAFQHDDLGEAAVYVANAGIVLEGNEIGDPVVVVLHGRSGVHQCGPKSFARTSADGVSRRRVSIAITCQSTRECSSNLRRARSRALSGAPWGNPSGAWGTW